jgi:hypothetical protein
MTVSAGNKALASDYNTLRAAINKWFADNYAGSISFGNANQTYGWGGSSVGTVSIGQLMTASQMNSLIDRCNIGEDICNGVSGQLSQIVAANLATAAEFNAIESKSNSINTNRLDIEAAELSLHSGGSSARSSTWSSAIDCTFKYTFTSFDKARYFFNSGGAFNISGSITGYSTGAGWDGAGFNEIFTNMGTVLMNYTQTTQSGSGGTVTSIGYYDLTTSYQTIFSQTGTGAYTDATLVIEARYGSSGAYVEIKVTLTPGSGRSVDGTTTITTQYRKLDDQTSGAVSLSITAPSYSLVDGL